MKEPRGFLAGPEIHIQKFRYRFWTLNNVALIAYVALYNVTSIIVNTVEALNWHKSHVPMKHVLRYQKIYTHSPLL